VGRFPPPLDGQALATERLASLLASERAVTRVDVGAPEGVHVVTTIQPSRLGHFLQHRASLARALVAQPGAAVLWPSVSPGLLGHARDRAAVVPAFGAARPVVAVVHRGDFPDLFERAATRWSGRRLVQRLETVVFLTEALAAACAQWVPDAKRIVIPNTIDDAAIPDEAEVAKARAARAARLGTSRRPEVRLLYLSGLIPSKGYPDVLEALAVLRGRGVDAQATFAGRWTSDAAERAFRSRVAELGVAESVALPGVVSRDAVRRLMLAHDLFVLPTAYPFEAQPLTVIEALATATPVIVTRHAGLPEMVAGGREAEFVPYRAPERIADAAEALVARWPSASQQARARFDATFAPAAVRTAWNALLASLPQRRTG
jgi:glycosyltransferase involved in cell wall biosynthesis